MSEHAPPRWFYPLLAACACAIALAALVAAAATWRRAESGRWVSFTFGDDRGLLDTRTGRLCFQPACFTVTRTGWRRVEAPPPRR